ncbi:MAG TPA: hypothetical protein VFT49_01770 [Candidatus Saccharimonadales bacterium]|nr:hypothetical protein [Candidatus Saccharimonadales bacterium]
MSEILDRPAGGEMPRNPLDGFSFIAGSFAEPLPARVNDIKKANPSHRTQTPELIMYTLELAGLIPSREQLELQRAEFLDFENVEGQEQALEAAAALRQAIQEAANEASVERLEMRPSQFDAIRQATSILTPANTPALKIIKAMATKHKHADRDIKVDALLNPTEAAYCEDVFRILAARQLQTEYSDRISGQYGV